MNYLTKTILFFLLLTLCHRTNAQPIPSYLTGKVTDTHNRPVDAALICLITANAGASVTQAITTPEGYFVLPCVDKEVKLLVTCLGYASYVSDSFQGGLPRDFNPIILTEESQQLDDIVVIGEKRRPIIEQKAGKLIFNVENSINAQGSNAFEVLRQTPGVTVDDGSKSISINGRGSILVMLNGKQTYMQQAEVVDLLKSTPSSNIKSIEVMSNATAQYDAAGSGGILNIVLKKDRRAGYTMTLNAGVSYGLNPKQNTEFSFNYNHKKINLYGNYSHNFGYTGLFYGGIRKQSGKLFDTHSDDTDKRNTVATAVGLDYEINSNHQVGIQASGNFLFGPGLIQTTNQVYDSYEGENLLYSIYSESEYYHQIANRYNFNVNYKYDLPEERSLTFDFDYSLFRGDSKNKQPNTYYSPMHTIDSVLNYRSFGKRDIDLYALTSNYRQKLGEGEWMGGIKFSNVASKNGYSLYDTTNADEIVDLDASNDFHYTESILASYLLYDFTLFDKWQFNLGCRLEYTHSNGHLLPLPGSINRESHVKRDYVDLFPSGGVTYRLDENHTLSLSYGKRIDRPVYSDLNPIEQPLDGLSAWKGNPFLKPQKTHRVGLQYQYRKTSVELSYSKTHDYRVGITDTLGSDKTVMIPLNLGTQIYYGMALSQSLRFYHAWDIHFSGRVYHLDNQMAFDTQRFYHRQRWACGFSLQTSFPLFWGIRSELLGVYSSKRLGGSTDVMGSNGLVNIGFQKKFLDDRAIVKLSLSDVFWTSNWDGVNRFDNFEIIGYGYGETRLVRLNFTFKFGSSPKSYVKKSYIESETNRF